MNKHHTDTAESVPLSMPLTEKEVQKFLTCFEKNPNGCWEWVHTFNGKEYGQFKYQMKKILAHRLSFLIFYPGESITPKDYICHKCDNPKCVNPEHLWKGNALENNMDKILKGKDVASPGSKNGNSKLTESQVLEIRKRYSEENISSYKLGKIYGVHNSTILDIVNRFIWAHIP